MQRSEPRRAGRDRERRQLRGPRLTVLLLGLGCARPAGRGEPAAALPFPVDTVRAEALGPGVTHRYLWSPAGPWAIHVLEVDLDRCYSIVAVKGAAGAQGRKRTSDLLRELSRTHAVIGGVNMLEVRHEGAGPVRRLDDPVFRMAEQRRRRALRVGDEFAAVSFGLEYRGRYSLLQVGYDEKFARFSPGAIHLNETIERIVRVHGIRPTFSHDTRLARRALGAACACSSGPAAATS